MIELLLARDARTPLNVLCLGAHSDDIEIGCGGTILRLTERYPAAAFNWVVLSGAGSAREAEARAGADAFLAGAASTSVAVQGFRESFFPMAGEALKEYFETLKAHVQPDLVFTHYRHDLHQDHKAVSDLTWNTFRNALILEYEIPKWDGDLSAPNGFVPLTEEIVDQKVQLLCKTFVTQRTKAWFTEDTFRALMRLRGIEAGARYAEAYYGRKMVLG